MNDARRKTLNEVIRVLEGAKTDIENIKTEEEESLEALPDSMKEGDKGSTMQEAIDNLDEAYNSVDSVIDYLNSASA